MHARGCNNSITDARPPGQACFYCYAYPLDCLAGDFNRLVSENAANPRKVCTRSEQHQETPKNNPTRPPVRPPAS